MSMERISPEDYLHQVKILLENQKELWKKVVPDLDSINIGTRCQVRFSDVHGPIDDIEKMLEKLNNFLPKI